MRLQFSLYLNGERGNCFHRLKVLIWQLVICQELFQQFIDHNLMNMGCLFIEPKLPVAHVALVVNEIARAQQAHLPEVQAELPSSLQLK